MTPDNVMSWAAATTVETGPGAVAWAVLGVLAVVAAIGGSTAADALLMSWREADHSDRRGSGWAVESWGEPDLAPPSQSHGARAEVAALEALWRR